MKDRMQKQKGTCRCDVRNGSHYRVVLVSWVGRLMISSASKLHCLIREIDLPMVPEASTLP